MRYCEKPFKHLYVANENGDCYFCRWMNRGDACLGNLQQMNLRQIYHSERAESIRETIFNQSFSYCSTLSCPYLLENSLFKLEEDNKEKFIQKLEFPVTFEIDYDQICNQNCETCRNEIFVPSDQYQKNIEIYKKKLLESINKGEKLVTSFYGDPFYSDSMLDFLHNLHPQNPDFKLELGTNGVYCDEEHWRKISHLSAVVQISLIIKLNSLSEENYPYISRNGDYKKLLENLSFIKQLRQAGEIDELVAKVVVQDRNFRELPALAQKCFEEYGFDKILLNPIHFSDNLKPDVFLFKDVLNSNHPYYEECRVILKNIHKKYNNISIEQKDFYIQSRIDNLKYFFLKKEEETLCVCTVLLISYNHVQYIEKAIKSVLNQETHYGYRICIFDDASTDGTGDIIKHYAQKYPQKIYAFIAEKNQGAQANFWRAVKSVDTHFCAILECDDYWCCNTKLEQQLNALYFNPECSFCAHNTRTLNIGDEYRKCEDNSVMVTLPQLSYNRVVTAHDLEMQYQGYINHENSRVIRMSCVDLDSLKDKESFLYDNAQFFYLLSKGPMYYINQVMSVYVQTGKGTFSGERANKKLRIHIHNLMQVNTETNYVMEKIIFEHLSSFISYWIWLLDVAEGKRSIGGNQNTSFVISKREKLKRIIKYIVPQFIIDIYKFFKRKLKGEK